MMRTRFAPSPTGYLHLGSVRTALYCYLWAKKNGGEYLLRMEDTDLERSTKESADQILDGFRWLGLNWDGEIVYQSQRLTSYQEAIEQLWQANKIYPAFEAEAELQQAREQAEAEKRTYIYSGASQQLTREQAQARMDAGDKFLWRLRIDPNGATQVQETLQSDSGTVTFAHSEIGDFPLTRTGTKDAPGMVLYNFCNVVDDHDQQITHVIRGTEHLVNTPKQVLLYQAFGWQPPVFTHLPLILKNGKKMSKRDKDTDPRATVSVTERRDQGYLPEALLNYMALLGWSFSGTEEFIESLPKMVELFDIQKLSKSNANFDEDKFLHFNALHIRHLAKTDPKRLIEIIRPSFEGKPARLEDFDQQNLIRIVQIVAERAQLITDFYNLMFHFFEFDGVDPEDQPILQKASAMFWQDITSLVQNIDDYKQENIDSAIKSFIAEKSLKAKEVMMPLRVAITGSSKSAGGIAENMYLLGKKNTLRRLQQTTV